MILNPSQNERIMDASEKEMGREKRERRENDS
jgi:hypothetical protein